MELQRVPKNIVTDLKDTDITAGTRNSLVYAKTTRDEAQFPSIGSRLITRSTSYTTSGLTSFRQLQIFPATPVSSLEEHQFQHSNSKKAPCTPNRFKMRGDSLALTEEVSELSTSTSRGGFTQQ